MTDEKPKRKSGRRLDGTREGTKHHIVRIDDEHWQRLQEMARQIVTTPKPPHARVDSTWQLTEMLRLLADGDLIIVKAEKLV